VRYILLIRNEGTTDLLLIILPLFLTASIWIFVVECLDVHNEVFSDGVMLKGATMYFV